jgi:hypothetical protein
MSEKHSPKPPTPSVKTNLAAPSSTVVIKQEPQSPSKDVNNSHANDTEIHIDLLDDDYAELHED